MRFAEHAVQRLHEASHPRIGDAVMQVRPLPPPRGQAFPAQAHQVLGQGRLGQAHPLREVPHRHLALGRELAGQHQLARIGELVPEGSGILRMAFEFGNRDHRKELIYSLTLR